MCAQQKSLRLSEIPVCTRKVVFIVYDWRSISQIARMIEATCPHCEEMIGADEAAVGSEVVCAACGATFVLQALRPRPRPREGMKKSAAVGNLILAGVLLLIASPLIGALIWYQSLHNKWDAEEQADKQAREERVAKWRADNPEAAKLADAEANEPKKRSNGDQIGAWVAIQQAVEQRLTSPSSAKFPFGGHRSVKHLGGGRYSVSSYVEAQNGFGATVRTPFSGIVESTGTGWRVESMSLDQ